MASADEQKRLQELVECLYAFRYLDKSLQSCRDWAIAELEDGNTTDDVAILAGLDEITYHEVKPYIDRIVGREVLEDKADVELWSGKQIVVLREAYTSDRMSIKELNKAIAKLEHRLDHPGWLRVLAYNSEYSDLWIEPFDAELKYISDLWTEAIDLNAFKQKYDRISSEKHRSNS